MASVLIVDDEPGVRESLVRALGLERYDVASAGDGREALDALAERTSTRSCSTSRCPRSTGSRSAGGCGLPAIARRC